MSSRVGFRVFFPHVSYVLFGTNYELHFWWVVRMTVQQNLFVAEKWILL
jgi:hypothetical protein